jgi:hypothetical protein
MVSAAPFLTATWIEAVKKPSEFALAKKEVCRKLAA